jgi:Protein of unknown function (DUF2806)
VSADEKKSDGLGLKVGADGVAASASDAALVRIGQAFNWLMPKKAARARISAALADSVAQKIRANSTLNEAELYFFAQVFEHQGRLLANREAVAEEVERVLPGVGERIKALPPSPVASPSAGFVAKAESIASEVTEDEVRTLFAGLIAAEACRPGSVSLRTLEIIRSLDPSSARAFNRFCRFVSDGDGVVADGAEEYLAAQDLGMDVRLNLQDVGLIDSDTHLRIPGGSTIRLHFGDRQIGIHLSKSWGAFDDFWLEYFRLTTAGKEMARVLPYEPDYGYFDVICQAIADRLGGAGQVGYKLPESEDWMVVPPSKNAKGPYGR